MRPWVEVYVRCIDGEFFRGDSCPQTGYTSGTSIWVDRVIAEIRNSGQTPSLNELCRRGFDGNPADVLVTETACEEDAPLTLTGTYNASDDHNIMQKDHDLASPPLEAINQLFSARSELEAREAFWRVNNRVVVQGQLFESSVKTTEDVVHRLRTEHCSSYALRFALDLLVELAGGESDASEAQAGRGDLGEQCRTHIVPVLECLKQLRHDHDERIVQSVADLVDLLERDPGKRNEFATSLHRERWSPTMRDWMAQIAW